MKVRVTYLGYNDEPRSLEMTMEEAREHWKHLAPCYRDSYTITEIECVGYGSTTKVVTEPTSSPTICTGF